MNVIILSDEELTVLTALVGNKLPRTDLNLSNPPSVLETHFQGTCLSCFVQVHSNNLPGNVCCPQCGGPVRS